jgi:hypothetical protein
MRPSGKRKWMISEGKAESGRGLVAELGRSVLRPYK